MIGKIIGTGSYLPATVWDNHKIEMLVETSDAWIRERTGIVKRHISEDIPASVMAIEAAKKALEDAVKSGRLTGPQELDAVFVCTVTADIVVPCLACEVQKAIGAENAFCYDVNAACAGFVFAYNMAVSYMNMGVVKKALIIGAEQLSGIVNWSDRGSSILFGDGAGAVLVEAVEGKAGMCMHSDGAGGDALKCNVGGKLSMDGQKVFRFAVKRVPEVITELMGQMGITDADVDYYILHQANLRIVESVVKRLNISREKVPVNIECMGNTSSASIPILLDELCREKLIGSGTRMVLAGFGAGLSWGAGYITM